MKRPIATDSSDPAPHGTIPYPGHTDEMDPQPRDEMADYVGRDLLAGKRALITGGDSGIGRAVAAAFAKEGADVAIAYLDETDDAEHTVGLIEAEGRRGVALPGDLADPAHCRQVVTDTVAALGGLDILVNNVAYQSPVEDTASINGLRGNKTLIDYSATKGAVIALTYSLSQALRDRGIRVNCVAPGPVWTPLIPATMDAEKTASFGEQAPMGRAAQPDEIAPSYVFFAAGRLSSYYSGEVLAPIGGETLPG
ncbi:SDR family oxidoreductase [Mycolicibacterium diernhoferi]|uniref:NAD(P)-dependent oxidoreductase n=1 Tax=Mycolicibacterium diernhoferi TaxID=1801 RepID=A0A1Q4H5N6_9MYCO|nr:SDR family oxidoreductase [Mycolicibacterium diernhoferi]OJZ62773.1 NAD(P)-dependent oxidoreductase [Mycolicibacterium diernhoferi]OPE54410.1 NAD(P)-dependent oxidoreductase [Mycolicibacterium diernhoferi]PEG55410.1 NAD(P)-dependent oxidoreductase [Mycolicibacterium diernhoferi]QYL24328.1 SDR family oxidoreductase [Mycolicibacterium diernhoferi]